MWYNRNDFGDIMKKKLYELYYIVLMSVLCKEYEAPYDMDIIWNDISEYYYKKNKVHVDDRWDLYTWLKNEARYDLLDDLMLQVFDKFANEGNTLNKADPFFITNIHTMKDIMLEQGKNINKNKKQDNVSLSRLNHQQVNSIVKDILREIDDEEEWLNIYESMEIENIVYIDLLDNSQKKSLEEMLGISLAKDDINTCVFLQNKGYIFLTYTGTISDVVTTMHEVIHYISRYKNNFVEEEPTLREFSSIFYELYALDYLKKIGYSEQEINKINQDRLSDMTKLLNDASYLMDYLIMIMKYGKIKEKYDTFQNKYLRADKCINNLVINPYLLNDYYPYLIGNYLAVNAISRMKNDKLLLSMIKYITDNLPKIEAYDVFSVLNCNNDLVRKDANLFKSKVKKKKINKK